jgi:hypothetical protein
MVCRRTLHDNPGMRELFIAKYLTCLRQCRSKTEIDHQGLSARTSFTSKPNGEYEVRGTLQANRGITSFVAAILSFTIIVNFLTNGEHAPHLLIKS